MTTKIITVVKATLLAMVLTMAVIFLADHTTLEIYGGSALLRGCIILIVLGVDAFVCRAESQTANRNGINVSLVTVAAVTLLYAFANKIYDAEIMFHTPESAIRSIISIGVAGIIVAIVSVIKFKD